MVWMDVQSPFCVWRVHKSCENGGFPSVQTKGSVEGEIAVIHALGRIFLHGLRKRVHDPSLLRGCDGRIVLSESRGESIR